MLLCVLVSMWAPCRARSCGCDVMREARERLKSVRLCAQTNLCRPKTAHACTWWALGSAAMAHWCCHECDTQDVCTLT